jgi:hypothetical protein
MRPLIIMKSTAARPIKAPPANDCRGVNSVAGNAISPVRFASRENRRAVAGFSSLLFAQDYFMARFRVYGWQARATSGAWIWNFAVILLLSFKGEKEDACPNNQHLAKRGGLGPEAAADPFLPSSG